jgi:hypothetical protein
MRDPGHPGWNLVFVVLLTPTFYRLQADNQANIYGGTRTNVSTHEAIKWYLSQGATASKINMGETQMAGSNSSSNIL